MNPYQPQDQDNQDAADEYSKHKEDKLHGVMRFFREIEEPILLSYY
jgi:hypothetical protein